MDINVLKYLNVSIIKRKKEQCNISCDYALENSRWESFLETGTFPEIPKIYMLDQKFPGPRAWFKLFLPTDNISRWLTINNRYSFKSRVKNISTLIR